MRTILTNYTSLII